MIRILSTRTMHGEAMKMATDAGIMISCYNMIRTIPLVSKQIQQSFQQGGPLVLTSVKAVESLQLNVPREQMPPMDLYCIEGRTRELALKTFPQLRLKASAQHAAELASKMLEALAYTNSKVLYPCGNQRRGELPGILSDAGIDVEEIMAYETVLTPRSIDEAFDGYIFFSPTAVSSFLSMNQLPAGAPCFVIGQTTAASLSDLGNPVVVAALPREEILVDALIDHYR